MRPETTQEFLDMITEEHLDVLCEVASDEMGNTEDDVRWKPLFELLDILTECRRVNT